MARSPKKVCSVIGLALFAMMLVWIGSMFVLSMLLQSFAPTFLESDWGIWILNDAPLYLLAAPVYLLILRLAPDGQEAPREKKPFGIGKYLMALVFCLGATYAISMVTNILVSLIDMLRGSTYTDGIDALANTGGPLQSILFGAVVPALGEEFLFRYMLRRKLRGGGDKIYIVLSGLCFGLFHANVNQIGYAMVVGMLFAYLYLRTGSIWVPIALHFLLNTLGMTVVPALMELGDAAVMGVVIGEFALIAGAAVVFGLSIRKVLKQLQPPAEPGWPYKPPRSNLWEQAAQPPSGEAAYGGYGANGAWGPAGPMPGAHAPYAYAQGYGQHGQGYTQAHSQEDYSQVYHQGYDRAFGQSYGQAYGQGYTQAQNQGQGQAYGQNYPGAYEGAQYPGAASPGFTAPSHTAPTQPAPVEAYHRPPPIRHSQGVAPPVPPAYAQPYGGVAMGGYPGPVQQGPYGYGAPQPPYYYAYPGPGGPPGQQAAPPAMAPPPPWQPAPAVPWRPDDARQQVPWQAPLPAAYYGNPPPYAAPRPKRKGFGRICIANVGMILYLCLVGIMTLVAFL